MSKFVKKLITDQLKDRFDGVSYAMLVSFVGLNSNQNHALRTQLAAKGIKMTVIKNSLARRAAEGTPLGPVFENLTGSCAVCWGGTDVVNLAKELVKLSKDRNLKGLEIKAAVMDGEALDSKQAVEVSKWPTREEQIALLLGQISGVGASLNGQLIAVGGALASQIKKKAGDDEDSSTEAPAE